MSRAVGGVLAFHMEWATVLAVPMPVEAEVQAGAEQESGVGDRGRLQRAFGSVGHGESQVAAEEPPVHRVDLEVVVQRDEVILAAVGMFDAALQLRLLPPAQRVRW